MNKVILLASLALGGLVSAQQSGNSRLAKKLQEHQEKVELQKEFFEQKFLGRQEDTLENTPQTEAQKKIREFYLKNRNNIAFFVEGQPVFLNKLDTDQNQSSNVDIVQNGNISGLEGDFLGEGLKITVIDGGKARAEHDVFQENGVSRVNNKETDVEVGYDEHSTAVTSMIGGKDNEVSFTQNRREISGNTRGVLPKATFDNYTYSTSEIDGTRKTYLRKLYDYAPAISNHSYGMTAGWSRYMGLLPIYYGYYDNDTQQSYNLLGSYTAEDYLQDWIIYENPHMIVLKAAGNSFGNGTENNDGFVYSYNPLTGDYGIIGYDLLAGTAIDATLPDANCLNGYDCISAGAVSKNFITVGATEKIDGNRYTQSSDVVKASYSDAGPRDDGAIKPDITAVGSNIISASSIDSNGNSTYEQGDGTSYSTPHITGIIGLWQQINQSLSNTDLNAASAKTLLIHTAQDAGNVGPDVWYGWGFADAKAGAEFLVNSTNNQAIFENKTLENNDKHEIYLKSDGNQPLKVSISWIDPPYVNYGETWEELHNNRTPVLVNDLDLRITNIETGEVFYPWKLDINNPMAPAIKGDNIVDNVEQVLIDTPVAGTYKVEVSHKGTLTMLNDDDEYVPHHQDYTIAASGFNHTISDDKIDTNTGFNIYPTLIKNEDADKIVNISFSKKEIGNVSLYDMSGRLLKSDDVNGKFHQIDFSNLKDGVYVVDVKLSSSKETITRKVLKR